MWSAGERCCICSSERRADVMAAVLDVWRLVGNPPPPIDAYLLEEQSCQILIWFETTRAFNFFWKSVAPINKNTNIKAASWCWFLEDEERYGISMIMQLRTWTVSIEAFAQSLKSHLFGWGLCQLAQATYRPCSFKYFGLKAKTKAEYVMH